MTKVKCQGCSRECFSLCPDFEPDDCTGNEEREENFRKLQRNFDASREARGY